MTPLVTICALFIFSVIVSRFLAKRKRDVPLSKTEIFAILGTLLTIVWAVLSIISDYIVPNLPLFSKIPPQAIWTIFGSLLVITIIMVIIAWKKNHDTLDPRFKNLRIVYSRKTDTPDTKQPDRPYYVVNNNTKQAYYVPDLIVRYIRHHKFSWNSYESERAILAHFKRQDIHNNDDFASDRQLGLWYKPNGSLVLAEPTLEPEILSKLKKRMLEGKFKHFQIVFLYPRIYWFLRFEYARNLTWPPAKRLLVNTDTKEAFPPPPTSMALVENGIIGCELHTPRPWEDISAWCKRKRGWTFEPEQRVTVEELVGDYQ